MPSTTTPSTCRRSCSRNGRSGIRSSASARGFATTRTCPTRRRTRSRRLSSASSTRRSSARSSRPYRIRGRWRSASSRGRKISTRPTTSNAGADLSPSDLGRAPPGDAPRQARVRDRRGRRRLRRRVQGHARVPGGVRAVARDRLAAVGDGDRRRLHRRRDHGDASGRRDAVRRLHLVRLGPARDGRRQAVLPRRHADPDRRPAAVRRRLLRRPVPLPEPGELVRAHRRPEGRLSGDARGCKGPADQRDRGSESRPLLRAQAPLPPGQGGRARGAVHDAVREGADVSVVTWGAMVYTAGEAAQQLESDDISVEILDLRTLVPWDRTAVLESARKTSKVLVLHEDTRTGGFGAEIAATIAEDAFEHLDAPLKRIAAPDSPVPFSPPLEKAFIPQVDDVAAGLRELAEY